MPQRRLNPEPAQDPPEKAPEVTPEGSPAPGSEMTCLGSGLKYRVGEDR